MSVPHLWHSHLLPRSLHQEQPLRSSCRLTNTALLRQKEESGSLAKITSSTGYEPNAVDNFDYSETCAAIFQEQSSDTMPSYLHDAELSDNTIGKALSSSLFTQEREEPAGRRQAYHSVEESLLSSQSLSVCHVRTGRDVRELSSLGSGIREKPSREREDLQKSHVLKVEELSSSQFSEDFLEVTSLFQGSKVKTVYNLGDNDAKCPDAEIWRRAHQEFAGFTTVPSGARSKCEPVAGLSLAKRKLVSTCTVNFHWARGDP